MTRLFGVIGLAVVFGGAALSAQAPDPKLVAQGKKLYATYKCDKCHMIDGRGTKKVREDAGLASRLLPGCERGDFLRPTPALRATRGRKHNPPRKGVDKLHPWM